MLMLTAVAEAHRRLEDATHGAKREIIAMEAQRLGVSVNTLYRALRRFRGSTRKRADKGRPRKALPAIVAAVALAKAKCHDRLNDRIIPTEVAIRLAEQNGHIAAGAISRRTYDRHAARLGLHGEDRIYARFQASRSNQLHQVDCSGAKYLRAVERREDGEWLIAVRKPEYSRKRADEPYGLWCTRVIDDHSRVAFAHFSVAPGESALMVINTLTAAWSGHPQCAIRGLPEKVQCDHGPFRRSQEGPRFCESVGVELPGRTPKTPNAAGKVERPWRTQFGRFELVFLAQPDLVMTLTELNARLASYEAERNSLAHPFWRDRSREMIYADGLDAAAVRTLPENLADAIFREDIRRVNRDGTIQLHNIWYAVPDHITGWVKVLKNADGAMLVCSVETGVTSTVKPFVPHDADEYRAHAATPAHKLEKAAAAQEFKTLPYEPQEEATQIIRMKLGREAEIASPFAEAEPSFVNSQAAWDYLCRQSGVSLHRVKAEQPELAALLTELFQKKMTRTEVDSLVPQLRAAIA